MISSFWRGEGRCKLSLSTLMSLSLNLWCVGGVFAGLWLFHGVPWMCELDVRGPHTECRVETSRYVYQTMVRKRLKLRPVSTECAHQSHVAGTAVSTNERGFEARDVIAQTVGRIHLVLYDIHWLPYVPINNNNTDNCFGHFH